MGLLTDEEAMAFFKIKDKKTLRSLLKNGLDYIKIGKSRRFTEDMLQAYALKNSSLSLKK